MADEKTLDAVEKLHAAGLPRSPTSIRAQQAVDPNRPPGFVPTVAAMLESHRETLEAVLAPHRHLSASRFLKVALNYLAATTGLHRCTPASVYRAILQAAEVGLEVGGALKHASIVAYGNVAKLEIEYRGYLQLMRLSGEVVNCFAHVRYAADEFEFSRDADGDHLHHKPAASDRGAAIGAYAVVRYATHAHVEYMPWTEIMRIKERALQRSRGASSPWNTDEEEMARKTPIRRVAKYTPLSALVQEAIAAGEDPEGEESTVAARFTGGAQTEVRDGRVYFDTGRGVSGSFPAPGQTPPIGAVDIGREADKILRTGRSGPMAGLTEGLTISQRSAPPSDLEDP